MIKDYRLVGANLSPFKKLTSKQSKSIKKRKNFKNSFALRLQRKRLLKFFYGQKQGILTDLEKRIDVALFRVNFYSSIKAARQAILHKKVFLNGQILISPNYILRPGDFFSLPHGGRIEKQNEKTPKLLTYTSPSFEVNYSIWTAIYLYPAQFIATPFAWENQDRTPSKIPKSSSVEIRKNKIKRQFPKKDKKHFG